MDSRRLYTVIIGNCSLLLSIMEGFSLVVELRGHTEVELLICESDRWNLNVLKRILEDVGIVMTEVPRVF